jgi:ABC-2 type transport system permease protein
MRNIWTIAKREFDNYFNSPLAYVVAFAILFPVGIIFSITMFGASKQSMYGGPSAPTTEQITSWFVILLIFFCPAVTMRLLSDEARMGTLELLLTAPVRDFELVAGKWLGAFLFIFSLIMITLIFPIIMNNFVLPGIDLKMLFASYLGVVLVSAALIALGVGISAIFNNQFVAFFVTFALFFFLWILVSVPSFFMTEGGEGFKYFSIASHFFDSMNRGTIALGDIVYFVSLTALGLFIGTTAVETRRWR